jgi:hypothetical protein
MTGGWPSELDVAIERVRDASTGLAADLLALDGHPARALLDPSRCSGATAARAAVALDRLAWLWDRYLELSDLAAKTAAPPGERGRTARRREQLATLLREARATPRPGPPHPEPGDPGPGGAGPGGAGPGGAGPADAGPAPLLPDTAATVARVRADFEAVMTAWNGHTAALAGTEEKLGRLTAEAARIGRPGLAELAEAAGALAAVSAAVAADPLGVTPEGPLEARAVLERAAAVLGELTRAYDALDGGLRDAGALLDQIVDAATEGEWSARDAVGKIRLADGDLLRLTDGWLEDPERGLRPWLERLRGLAAGAPERRLAAARGLAAWRAVAEETLERARRVAEVNAIPLRRRGELRGLLRALRQKAVGTGRAEDTALEAMFAAAHRALYTAPTDLAAAGELVTGYAAALNRAGSAPADGNLMDEGRGGAA